MQMRCLAQSAHDVAAIDDNSTHTGQDTGNSYRALQWSADGTCLVTTDYANNIKTFVVPVDLLEEHPEPLFLRPYSVVPSSEPISAVIGVPFFDLQNPSTSLALASVRDHPLRLSSALTGERVASYPVINSMTEKFICPNALAFSLDSQHIIAGSESLLSIFDISYSGREPLHSIQTGPKRLRDDRWNPSTSVRGIISALGLDPSTNLLAVGTFSRQIGLYEAGGVGECVGAFSLAGNAADAEIHGSGVTQVKWSSCGRYLFIAERKSDGVMVYDIRHTGQLLSWCTGRQALTNQRLAFDVDTTDSGTSVWAGGTDGVVRVWKDIHLQEGAVLPAEEGECHTGESKEARLVLC